MAETRNKLTAVQVKGLPAGRHSDGAGLYLTVKPKGSRSWVYMWKRDGRRRELGLGAYPAITLAAARARAAKVRAALAEGRDPLEDRLPNQRPRTFADVTDLFLADNEGGWRNAKHRAQWRNTLATYAEPINKRPVADVDTEGVLRCLRPIWREKPETASRVRGRIERVLAYAAAHGWRDRERVNPAGWSGHLAAILPKPSKLTRGHHAAMPYRDVPAFMAELAERKGLAARALAFTVLTAARSGEVRGATRDEIDGATWRVPAVRTKAGREHRVPLSDPALAILETLPTGEGLVFPSTRGKPLSDMTLGAVLKRMGLGGVTVHGFRSSFRDWVSEETTFAGELAEMALAHTIKNAAEAAYRRGDLLEKRREMMAAWADHCGRAT